MNVVTCTNGHFFDSDTYQTCPHCGASIKSDSMSSGISQPKEKKKAFFGRNKEKNVSSKTVSISQMNTQKPNSETSQQGNNRDSMREYISPIANNPPQNKTDSPRKYDTTLDFWQISSASQPIPEPIQSDGKIADAEPTLDGISQDSFSPSSAAPSDNLPELQASENTTNSSDSRQKVSEPQPDMSLQEAIKQASATSEGKTMSYFGAVSSEASSAGENVTKEINEPVVGWLVCIQGEHFGESFCINAGMNSIGRSSTNKIVLERDRSISREKHALITYEPKHRKFYVKPGDSSGLTYVNDEYITETKMIFTKDTIELGHSKFIFIPLCGDDFTWENYIKE